MLNWITCYLSGNHEFTVACEPGEIFLRCTHCGKRTHGWALSNSQTMEHARVAVTPQSARQPRTETRALSRAA
jgi:hypothetical protein